MPDRFLTLAGLINQPAVRFSPVARASENKQTCRSIYVTHQHGEAGD